MKNNRQLKIHFPSDSIKKGPYVKNILDAYIITHAPIVQTPDGPMRQGSIDIHGINSDISGEKFRYLAELDDNRRVSITEAIEITNPEKKNIPQNRVFSNDQLLTSLGQNLPFQCVYNYLKMTFSEYENILKEGYPIQYGEPNFEKWLQINDNLFTGLTKKNVPLKDGDFQFNSLWKFITEEKIKRSHYLKGKIEDTGAKIGGAKKDWLDEYIFLLQQIKDIDLIKRPLREVFPRPNFKELYEQGIINQNNAIFLSFLYDNIPTKPRDEFKMQEWLSSIEITIKAFKTIIESQLKEDLFKKYKTTNHENLGLERYFKIMKALDFPEKDIKLKNYDIQVAHTIHGTKYYITYKNRYREQGYENFEDAISALKKQLLLNKSKRQINLQIFRTKEHKIFIGKKTLGSEPIILKAGFSDSKVALAYLREHRTELEEKWNKMKDLPSERREFNNTRSGINWRQDQDISPDNLIKILGFRGIEFGNWVKQNERQNALNNAYDSFMDLAYILNIPPQAVSLNGELSIGFGSRGNGNYGAHYEPGKVVINLTKTNGAGCLAHEWFHSIDNYFARMGGNRLGHATESTTDINIREEIKVAFNEITSAINKSEIVGRSWVLDTKKSKPYFSKIDELSARCFEKYVLELLKKNHFENDFLVNFRTLEEWKTAGQIETNYPYPLDSEQSIIKSFENFFDTLQYEKKGENTVLFNELPKDHKIEKERIVQDAKENGTYLKAPNGKPTNLSEEQWVQVRTSAFKNWFGDWENNPVTSMVLDKNLEPKVIYHGSPYKQIHEFTKTRSKIGWTYVTEQKKYAKEYHGIKGGKTYPLFTSAKILDIDKDKQAKENLITWLTDKYQFEIAEYIKKNGLPNMYDDVIYDYALKNGYQGIKLQERTKYTDGYNATSIAIFQATNKIKSAKENNGEFSLTNNDIRFNIIGYKGAINNPDILNNLDTAQLMEKAGKTSEEIYLATGWERSKDKDKWKYDLPADNIRYLAGISGQKHFGQNTFTDTLSNILDYERLYKCYPELREIKVNYIQDEKQSQISGKYSDNQIFINTHNLNTLEQLKTLIHEIQHAIQNIEGFAVGGNIEMFEEKIKSIYRDIIFFTEGAFIGENTFTPSSVSAKLNSNIPYTEITYKEGYKPQLDRVAQKYGYKNIDNLLYNLKQEYPDTKYHNLAGEVEARNAEARLNMTARERAMTPISYSEDVIEKNKLYIYSSKKIHNDIDQMSKALNVQIIKAECREQLPEHIQKLMSENSRYPGMYDVSNDKIYMVIAEIKTPEETQATILHETLVHKGIRSLFPNEYKQKEFFNNIWEIMSEQDRKNYLQRFGEKNIAAEEYLAKQAENYKDPKVWEKIKGAIRSFFRKLGIDLKISDKELRYILFQAKRSITRQSKISAQHQEKQNTISM